MVEICIIYVHDISKPEKMTLILTDNSNKTIVRHEYISNIRPLSFSSCIVFFPHIILHTEKKTGSPSQHRELL